MGPGGSNPSPTAASPSGVLPGRGFLFAAERRQNHQTRHLSFFECSVDTQRGTLASSMQRWTAVATEN